MKDKKVKKVIKIIFLVILAIIILFLMHTLRNFIIIKDIQNKVAPYLASTNYYIKTTSTEKNGMMINMDYYTKDGKQTMIMERNHNGEITTMSIYNNGKRKDIFWNTPDGKKAQLDANTEVMVNIFDYFETENDLQTFLGSMTAKIKKIDYNGKKCYVVNDFSSSLFMNGIEKNEIYVEEDTGLYVKMNMDGEVAERQYEFDNVNDEIFVEPDIGEYEIQENNE